MSSDSLALKYCKSRWDDSWLHTSKI